MSDPKTDSIKALRHFADGGEPFGDGPNLLTIDAAYFKGLIDRLEAAEAELDAWMKLLSNEELERLRALLEKRLTAPVPRESKG